jgi:hypothetical protein
MKLAELVMKLLDPIIKNEFNKKILNRVGLRKPFVPQEKTNHYRMPILERNGGYLQLKPYSGPEVPESEWLSLEYTTYPSDPSTFFAPIASPNGENILRGFWDFGKTDKDGILTPNAKLSPTIVKWVESVKVNYGRVQLIRMDPNSMREAHWGLHLDDNNRLNPEGTGWVVRVWLELTHDPNSCLIVRKEEFDAKNEVRIPLPKYAQAVVDSEFLFHGAYHAGPHTRYAVIASFESGPALEKWIESQI